jgi:Kef-type K+ transport system membrane component KefB
MPRTPCRDGWSSTLVERTAKGLAPPIRAAQDYGGSDDETPAGRRLVSGAGATTAVIGGLLLVGLLAEWSASKLPIPRVSVLIVLGLAVGPIGLDLLPAAREQWFPVVSAVALVMVGFLIGGEFTTARLGELGARSAVTALVQAVGTAVVVGAGLLAVGVDAQLALPLAGVATATAPAAVAAVVEESGREGPFARLLLAIVAIDDAAAMVVFSLLLTAVGLLAGVDGSGVDAMWSALRELGGGIGVGVLLGVPAAYLTGRLRPGQPVLEEALGLVLLCAGLGVWLEVSYLLAAVVMGAVVANRASHHERPFREIEGVEWPFLVVFFLLAGASLELSALVAVGWIGVGYIVLRTLGKVAGAWLGVRIIGGPPGRARWLGVALLPHAGVALGLGLLADQQLPESGGDVLAIVVGATVVFELIGPLGTRLALERAD